MTRINLRPWGWRLLYAVMFALGLFARDVWDITGWIG